MKKFKTVAILLVLTLLLSLTVFSKDKLPSLDVSKRGFVENKGQVANSKGEPQNDVLFTTSVEKADLFFLENKIIFITREEYYEKTEESIKEREKGNLDYAKQLELRLKKYRFELEFNNANQNTLVEGIDKRKNYSNFFLAHCPEGIKNVAHYESILYKNIYPNIDLKFYRNSKGLKFDFIVNPGGDPNMISYSYNYAETLTKDEGGNINVITPYLKFTEEAPYSYILENNEETEVESSFLISENTVRFNIDNYSKDKTLIIDPTLDMVWSTYFDIGGSSTWDNVSFNSVGDFYASCYHYSSTVDVINGGGFFQSGDAGGSTDLAIIKFSNSGEQLWTTYYGGSGNEYVICNTTAVDGNDNLYVGGETSSSSDFPLKDGGGYYDGTTTNTCGFLLKFDDNTNLLWSTYIGASGARVRGITTSQTNDVYIVGACYSTAGLPVQDQGGGAYYQATHGGGDNGYIMRFNSSTSKLWCTYFGGDCYVNFMDIHIDPTNNNLYCVGELSGWSVPTSYPPLVDPGGGAYFDNSVNGKQDLFIARFNSSRALTWSTIYGGQYNDNFNGDCGSIDTDSEGNFYFCGKTQSDNLPIQDPGSGAYYQSLIGGNGVGDTYNDGYILKFNNAGVRQWATYYGGSNSEEIRKIKIDNSDNVWISGYTGSSDIPLQTATDHYNQTFGGSTDAFVARFTKPGVREWASCLGGTDYDTNRSFAIYEPNSTTVELFMVDQTNSTDFPTVNPGGTSYYISSIPTSSSAYISKFTYSTCIPSTDPTSITASNTTICVGSSVTLSVNGGSLGTNANWHWYSSSCGGTAVGTGASVSVSPTSTTTYYARAEGDCGTTSCVSVSINVNTESTSATSISASSNPICSGSSTTLTLNGGSLGTGASWHWYSSSCGGTAIGTGTSVSVSPTVATTYYVRAEGTCNTTNCVSITINLNTESTNPSSITATNTTICEGSSTTLTLNGGSLGTGASWHWYSSSCGGTAVGTGTSVSVSPTSTTTYYVRAEGTCNTTNCASITINVETESTSPTSISASNTTICEGSSTTLTVVGGSLGDGADWQWYESGCGTGSPVFSGNPINITPGASTTYYVRAEGNCNTTNCASIAITVTPAPNAGLDNSISVCESDPTINLFTQLGGSPSGGGTWTNSSGDIVTDIFDPTTMNSDIFTYTVAGTAPCGDASASVDVTVNSLPNANFTGLDPIYCGNGSALLTGNQAPNGVFTGTNVIDNGDGTATFNYNSTGNFDVFYTYTDANTCSNTDTQSVSVYNAPSVSFVGLDTVYCESNIVVNIIGNQAPNGLFTGLGITDNSDGTATFTPSNTGLLSIIYQYTDANTCSDADTQMVMVNESPNVDTLIVTDELCNGNDGSISAQVSGGNGTYQYLWSNNDTTSTISQLIAGTYSVTVNDANNCTDVASADVQNNSTGLNINISESSDVDCFGNNTAYAMLDTVGLVSCTYLWSNGDTTFATYNLSAGNYYVTVEDSVGCQGIDTVLIQEPDEIIYNDSLVNIKCFGDNNGEIYLFVSGGTPNYTYQWQGTGGFVSTDEYINNLSMGTYNVTVTDNNACSFSLEGLVITEPDTSLYLQINANPPLCYNEASGTAISLADGGTLPYIYNWSNGVLGSSISNLSAGSYYLTVTDANYCTTIDSVVIDDPDEILVSEIITDVSCMGNNDGSISIDIIGGTTPYDILWNISSVQTDTLIENLFAGEYVLNIVDFNKCESTYTYTVMDGRDVCLKIPSVITPNADGINDDFEIEGIWIYNNIQLNIFNRWGDLVYSFDGTGNGYNSDRWDGKYNGKDLPLGSFIYILDLNDDNSPIQGIVTIVR